MAIRKKPDPIIKLETKDSKPFSKKDLINSIIKRKQKNKFLSEHQEDYYNILKNNQITVASGPAGVGKSFIAMKAAVDLLLDTNNSYILKRNSRTNIILGGLCGGSPPMIVNI